MSAILQKAIDAHGGIKHWQSIKKITFNLTIGGLLWEHKALPQGLKDVIVTIEPGSPKTQIVFPNTELVGHFENDRAWFEDKNGKLVEELPNARKSFENHVFDTPWNKLQELYFVSYAFWNYFSTPFLFVEKGFEVTELGDHEENGVVLHKLKIRYPANFPAHSPEQIIYFSDDGLLRRLDYTVDVVKSDATHYCYDHQKFGDLVVPTLRRVVVRVNGVPLIFGPTAVLVQVGNVQCLR